MSAVWNLLGHDERYRVAHEGEVAATLQLSHLKDQPPHSTTTSVRRSSLGAPTIQFLGNLASGAGLMLAQKFRQSSTGKRERPPTLDGLNARSRWHDMTERSFLRRTNTFSKFGYERLAETGSC